MIEVGDFIDGNYEGKTTRELIGLISELKAQLERATQRHTPPPQIDTDEDVQICAEDSIRVIEKHGGTVRAFEVSETPEEHYEVTIDGKTYGPMIATELYWFAYGVSLWEKPEQATGSAQGKQ